MNSKHLNILANGCVAVALTLLSHCISAQDCPCPGMPIGKTEFDAYTGAYQTIFRNVNPARHTQWIYLPRNYFIFLQNFLNSETSFKGISFRFVSHNFNIDPDQQSAKQQIMFIAVAARSATNVDSQALQTFNLSDSTLRDSRFTKVELSSRRTTAPPSRIGPSHIIFPNSKAIANYETEHTEPRYTKAVYICKQQIDQVNLYLQAHPKYEGVKLHFASYNKIIPCVNDSVKEQFTLILVPVPNSNAKSDIDKYVAYFKKLLKDKFLDEFYNHGELCPNSCPSNPIRTAKKP